MFGAVGGFVGRIVDRSRAPNTVELPNGKSVPLGFFGDMIMGGVAAVIGYYFLSLAGDIVKSSAFTTTQASPLSLCAIGAIVGAGGRTVIVTIRRSIMAKISQVDEKVETLERRREFDKAVSLGNQNYERGAYDLALLHYQHAHKLFEDTPEPVLNQAKCYRQMGQIKRAITLCREERLKHPSDLRAAYNLACYMTLEGGSEDEAIDLLRWVVDQAVEYQNLIDLDSDLASIRGKL